MGADQMASDYADSVFFTDSNTSYITGVQPIRSTFNLRITHRRFISHILFETKETGLTLTILMTNGPPYHAFKSKPYALSYTCENRKQCLGHARKLDAHLRSGQIVVLRIQGSKITKIDYLNAGS